MASFPFNNSAPINSPTFTGNVTGVTSTMVGLGNVSNTSDALKPVSTAQATAIALKADQSTTYTKTEITNLSELKSNKNAPLGYQGLDATGRASYTNIPLYSASVAYLSGDVVRYTDSLVYFANGTIAATSLWVIGTIGATWAAVSSASASSSVLAAEYGSFVYSGASVQPIAGNNTPANSLDFMTFTLPSAGTWEVNYIVRGQGSGSGGQLEFAIFTSANVLLADTEMMAIYLESTAGSGSGSGLTRITTTAAATYKVRVWNAANNGQAYAVSQSIYGKSSVAWKKISGNLPVSGQTVDTLYVTRSASNQTIPSGTWSSKDIIFNSVGSGNIPYDTTTGIATLSAGKTYNIRSGLNWSAAALYAIQWQLVDAVSNIALGASVEQGQPASGTNNASLGILDYTYTPSANQTVKIRMTSGCNMQSGEYLRSDLNTYMSITQVGSSALMGIAAPTLTRVAANTTVASVVGGFVTLYVDATLAARTIILPLASASNNMTVSIKKVDASVNVVNVICTGTDTIDGLTTFSIILQYDTNDFRADSNNNFWGVH